MSNKITASLAAGAILVGAGLVATIVSSPGAAVAQEVDEGDAPADRGLSLLEEVLDDLVAQGDISTEDAETVLNAVAGAVEQKKAEREEIRAAIEAAFEDGELTLEEASVLPQDHWLFSEQFDEAWEDGALTKDEIQQSRPHPRRDAFRKGFRHGAHFGDVMDDGGMDQAEWDAIPGDSRVKNSPIADAIEAELVQDGLVTPADLREIWQAHKESVES